MASATPVSAALATGTSEVFTPQPGRAVCVTLTGTWTGTVTVQKSRDAGITWAAMTAAGSPWAVFTGNCDEPVDEPGDNDVRYRLLIALGTGTGAYRLGH